MLWVAQATAAQRVYITVKANGYARRHTVIEASLQTPLPKNKTYIVVNEATGLTAAVQQLDSLHLFFILPDVLLPDGAATYKVEAAKGRRVKPAVSVQKNAKGLRVKVQGKDLLFYNTAVIDPPDSLPSFYARSGFIHPLYSPAGKILTDDFPAGHAHQHGIMTAWPNAGFKGEAVDFWNQQQKTGSARHVKVESIEPDAVGTIIKLRLQQYSLAYGAVLSEQWTLTIYPFSGHYLFDLLSVQQNITADTLYLKKYHYGSIAFRGSSHWNDMDPQHFESKWSVLTDSGFTFSNADGKRAAYVSASGLIGGGMTGVAVFGFPANYNYPQPIRVHPQMPYWGFAPAATGPFSINPGEVYTSRYRYCVYDGPPDARFLTGLNNDLVHPAAVTVVYKERR